MQNKQIQYIDIDESVLIPDEYLSPLYDDLNTPGYIANLHKLFEISQKGYLKDKEILMSACNFIGLLNENQKDTNKLLTEILNDSPKNIENQNKIMDTFSYPLKEAREQFEKNYLTSQLKKNKGNISKTADFIGMERSALHRKLKLLGIKGTN